MRRSRRKASVIIGEAHALGRHVIEVGRCVALGAVDREIAKAHVIHKDDDKVGFAISGEGCRRRKKACEQQGH